MSSVLHLSACANGGQREHAEKEKKRKSRAENEGEIWNYGMHISRQRLMQTWVALGDAYAGLTARCTNVFFSLSLSSFIH